MSGLTLGVVGHVDHGKTALVRALTGIETDRLKEERERGLSIVLGFAFLRTEHGVVDLIDVPGHEDFIRAMVAGATALDGVLLCVAANEGIMPQTLEHFQIARLLGVGRGCVVITKTDLVGAQQLAAVKDALAERVRGSFLDGAPVIEVSAASGAGVDAVRRVLAELAAVPVEREALGAAFLPLDRAFTLRGFGLVVTGTLRGGSLAAGDAVQIVPAGKSATVRALQVHHRSVERAFPGQRVAVNLRHLRRDDVERGAVVATPGSIAATRRLDAELHLLEDAGQPVGNGAQLRLLTGTAEAIARVRLLDRRELAPGETALAQLNLDRDIATRPSEPLLLRRVSPVQTLGGGRILEVGTRRHRRFDARVTARLASAASGDLERIVRQRLDEAGADGIAVAALAERLGVVSAALSEIAMRLGAVRVGEDLAVAGDAFEALLAELVAALERFHAEHPLRKGLDAGNLMKALHAKTSLAVVRQALGHLDAQRKVQNAGGLFRIAGYDPFARLGEREQAIVRDIEDAFRAGGLQAPSPRAVVGSEKVERVVFALLLETGRLVRLRTYDRSREIILHADTVEDVKRALARRFPYPRPFAVKDARDLLQSTRQYVVPVMEHLDATGATVRNGDLRRLRAPSNGGE